MCGITGFVVPGAADIQAALSAMTTALSHRGPDDEGTVILGDAAWQVGLGHRRLSILDLSAKGHQPMTYQHLTIVHNGEVYNFQEIRTALKEQGYTFDSDTDTEVILKAFHCWGSQCVDKFRGMFAFAIFDAKAQKLYLFRDRLGVKPLYYYWHDGLFMFASELKAFHQHPKFNKQLNQQALPYYFRFGYIPAPLTIFAQAHKLEPGHYLSFDLAQQQYAIQTYWAAADWFNKPKFQKTEQEVVKEVGSLLQESCALRMVSDVPVGVLLSGGVDSSVVVALLKAQGEKLRTFTIGFEGTAQDESSYAQEIADYLGTHHTNLSCADEDILGIVKKLPYFYDEPFGDSSAIPTYMVSDLAKSHVSVILSGDGGDESFVGYSKYAAIHKINKLRQSKWLFSTIKWLAQHIDEKKIQWLNNLLPVSRRQRNIVDKYQKFKRAIQSQTLEEMFVNASSYVDEQTLSEILINPKINFAGSNFTSENDQEVLDRMTQVDYKTFMVDDVLTKVDRASMAVGLEAREPLLDHRIIEYMAQVPEKIKYKGNTLKYVLKRVLGEHVPPEFFERPKAGFQVPLETWLREDLASLVTAYLSPDRLERRAIYHVPNVLHHLSALKKGEAKNISVLWFILMFEMWADRWGIDSIN